MYPSAVPHAPAIVQISAMHGGDTSTRSVKAYPGAEPQVTQMVTWPWPAGLLFNHGPAAWHTTKSKG